MGFGAIVRLEGGAKLAKISVAKGTIQRTVLVAMHPAPAAASEDFPVKERKIALSALGFAFAR